MSVAAVLLKARSFLGVHSGEKKGREGGGMHSPRGFNFLETEKKKCQCFGVIIIMPRYFFEYGTDGRKNKPWNSLPTHTHSFFVTRVQAHRDALREEHHVKSLRLP